MIKRGKHIIRSYMTLKYEFTGIRLTDGFLTPVDWELTVDLMAPEKKGRSREVTESNAANVYQKLYFWLDTNLQSIVMVDVNKEDDLYIANLSSNIMMYCPTTPGDDIVIQLLHSKLSALAGDNLVIGQICLKGSDSTLMYTFDLDENGYQLPSTTSEYYTEGKARDELPWWSRDDGFCFEFIRPNDSELSDEELFKDIVDPMNEFEKFMADMTNTQMGVVKEPARIVQVEKWKPRKVE